MAHILNLKRDPVLTKDLIGTTFGTATLQSKDNEKVQVPLAPLLSSSKLIRIMVTESHLHPAIHGPLILSCEVSTEALVSVRDILGTGETLTSNDNIEEVKQVLSMLGVYADLSQDGNNEEHTDHEGVKLEIVFEMQDEEENCVSGIDEHDNSAKKEKRSGTDVNHNRRNSVHEDNTCYGEEIMARPEINIDNAEIIL